MNPEQGKAVASHALTGLLMYAVGRGWFPPGAVEDTVTFMVAMMPVIWTFYKNRVSGLIRTVDNLDVVKNVVLKDQALADSIPSEGVVSTSDVKVVNIVPK